MDVDRKQLGLDTDSTWGKYHDDENVIKTVLAYTYRHHRCSPIDFVPASTSVNSCVPTTRQSIASPGIALDRL